MRGLTNKTAIVTGAASGIGKATAMRFHEEGVRLLIADINDAWGNQLADDICKQGGQCAFVHCDVSNLDDVKSMIEKCVAIYGRIDILVNNAGTGTYGKTPDLQPAEWKRVTSICMDSVYYGCHFAIPYMRKGGGGAIVNTASVSGLFGDFGLTAYNAAKGAVVNYTRSLALDHGRNNIRCNAVCPGPIETNLTKDVYNTPGQREKFNACVPLQRVGRPEEIAAAIAFLASDDASYINGENLVVDGGMTVDTGAPSFSAFLNDE
jgi:meso-butanediol dehydrogenase/(S,S)-butanediol dehydrogenase/diacetyl reductase